MDLVHLSWEGAPQVDRGAQLHSHSLLGDVAARRGDGAVPTLPPLDSHKISVPVSAL